MVARFRRLCRPSACRDPRASRASASRAGLLRHCCATLCPPLVAAVAAIWIASWQGIPYLVLLVALCTFAAEFVMRRTRYGAQLYAIGGNPEAARLSGINVSRAIFWNFVIAGLGYGITGVALTARVSGAIGGSAGLFLELDAIAAAIIGGTSLSGGRGRVLGALLGALADGQPQQRHEPDERADVLFHDRLNTLEQPDLENPFHALRPRG